MKNVVYILIAVSYFACANDDRQLGENQTSAEEQFFTLKEVKEYLPEEYFSRQTKIVYKNNNQELILEVDPVESTLDRNFGDGSTHDSEIFEIILFNPEDLNFQIVMSAFPNLPEGNTSRATLTSTLMPLNESGSTWNTIRFENEEAIVSLGDDFYAFLELEGKNFNNVYKREGLSNPNNPAQPVVYSELDINSNEGVVAFRGSQNELWVFDRFLE